MLTCRRIAVSIGIVALAAMPRTAAIAQAAEPLTGTWKLNTAKSTFNPPDLSAPGLVVTYEVKNNTVTASLEGVDSRQRAVHTEYTATFDGTDHPVKGTVDGTPAPNQDTIAWTRIDARTYDVVNKTSGRVTTTRRIVVAADGKTRTTTIRGRDAQGRTIHHVMFFDRQ